MADRDPEQDNLFKEIDEELRQQKYANLWKKYGKFVILFAAAIVIIVASVKVWESYKLERKSKDSKLLYAALKSINLQKWKDAEGILQSLAKKGSQGYSQLALFNHAAMLAKQGKKQSASLEYLKISENGAIGIIYRDLALVLSALHGMDTKNPERFIEKLSQLIDGKNAWRHSAKELSALLEEKLGNTNKARKLYRELSDDSTTPAGIRARATEMLAILSD